MTSKLEKQFFDTFGINKRIEFETCHAIDSSYTYSTAIKRYPQITDSILLELICILNTRPVYASNAHGTNVYDLKNYVLKRCIYEVDNIKQQVHALFGGNND